MAELVIHAWGVEIHNKGLKRLLDTNQLRKNNIKRLDPSQDVHCECGSEHEEDAMVGFFYYCSLAFRESSQLRRWIRLTYADAMRIMRAFAAR